MSYDNQGGYGQPDYNQGGGYGAAPQGSPPPNYLAWAIISTLLCCLPLGIVSIIFAAQVNGKWNSGDFQGAQDASKKAKLFAMLSTIIGLVVIVIYVIAIIAVGPENMS